MKTRGLSPIPLFSLTIILFGVLGFVFIFLPAPGSHTVTAYQENQWTSARRPGVVRVPASNIDPDLRDWQRSYRGFPIAAWTNDKDATTGHGQGYVEVHFVILNLLVALLAAYALSILILVIAGRARI